ncbi:cbb3-type cytochrome oxidase subunit 3 [Endozoicomonas sp.]|uniref:cbb3-type cytochrome oxidase subunit 3 n=1 Tax=Endozoicomonas sp. TaxID=1892382 RepID=UPI002884DDF7|nr:cbb3-type cytochrome c oxidase subunit 3 [Endozoicomonas sp.]
MDINTIRGLATLAALVAFTAVVLWAYSGRKKNDFEEAAALPFADESPSSSTTPTKTSHRENSRTRGVE